MQEDEQYLGKYDIMEYGFYDENGKYNVKIDIEKLKDFFNADNITMDRNA